MHNGYPSHRSWNMSRIKGKKTKPELQVRSYLSSKGVRYRCNVKELPGRPDISNKRCKLVLEVRGCYWHGHKDCKHFRLPKTRTGFWLEKISATKKRDRENIAKLEELGFRVFEIWECEIKSGSKVTLDKFVRAYFQSTNIERR